MKLIKVKYTTTRSVKRSRYIGDGCTEETHYQNLNRVYLLFGIIPIWRHTYHSEEVPSFAILEHGVFGNTNWLSPHRAIINEHIRKQQDN